MNILIDFAISFAYGALAGIFVGLYLWYIQRKKRIEREKYLEEEKKDEEVY